MAIEFARVEDRLIHGQVTVTWAKTINFDTIAIVDDLVASDQLLIALQKLACPPGKKLLVMSLESAKQELASYPDKVFLLVKSPIIILKLVNAGVKIPKLNFGSIFHDSKKKEVFKNLYMSEQEIDACKQLISLGIVCEIQKLPTDSIRCLNDYL